LSLQQSCQAQQVIAFSQELGRIRLGTAWFEAEHHPAGVKQGRIKGEQMAMQQTAKAVAHHGPFADFAAYDNGATPG
jgi:hypothetical protein